MSLESAKRQKSEQMELPLGYRGEAPETRWSGEAWTAANGDVRSGTDRLMEEVVGSGNVEQALKRVMKNKGSPGADGMAVGELPGYLAKHWEGLREQLLAGTYQAKPVRRHELAKEDGGVRILGIPCVIDRFVQQAILQVLQPRFDPTFSRHSYGFRPGKSAHDAVNAAQRLIQEGREWVVDVDLEKFFDRVNHDVLMGRLAGRIADKRLLKLIRRYLEAGMMANGVVMERQEGTPQGGPLSPLLANVLLDEVDKELEKRGHAFVRYADDCNVYVRSRRAGARVMAALERMYARLRLRVNRAKSKVELAQPAELQLLVRQGWRGHVPSRTRSGPRAQAARAADNQMQRRTEPENCGRGTEEVPAGVEAILPTGGHAERFRRTRQMAPPPAASAATQTVEARLQGLRRAA